MSSKESLVNEGFIDEQIVEILEGESKNLDVSIYKDVELMAIQMREIRLGLEEKLSVELYAKKEFDWLQMMEIRKGLLNEIDAEMYASKNISYDKMREIRKGLENGVVILKYLMYDAGIMRQIRKAIECKVDIMPFVEAKYDTEQLDCIRECLKEEIDIYPYITNELRGEAINEIAKGLKMNVDVDLYSDVKYNWQQMREIRKGLQNRIDVKKYLDEKYSWQQMREIRKGLEKGLDVSNYSSFMYTANEMNRIRVKMWSGMIEGEEVYRHSVLQGIEITIGSDEMEAFVVISKSEKEKYTVEAVLKELKKHDIVEGIKVKEIKKAIDNPDMIFLVAEGIHQQDGMDGYNEYFFNTEVRRQPKLLEDGSVDYANSDWYKCVKEGDVIAKYHEATDGVEGKTVKGRIIAANKGKELSIHEMEGCKLLDDKKTYVATVSGKVDLVNNKLIVTSLFEIDEVNPSIGHIDFTGDVLVKGNVGAGSVIKASGDIVIYGFVEGAEIIAGGNIEIRLGVNASYKGIIQAGKDVYSKYFESAIIKAENDIHTNNILNSDVKAGGKIIISGSRGSIIGGKTYAFIGIESQNLGNIARMDTEIRMGLDDEIIASYNEMIASIKDIEKEISILTNAHQDIQRKHPPEVRNVMDMFIKIEKALVVKNKHLKEAIDKKDKLLKYIDTARACKAIIKGNVYEGVVVSIDNSTWYSPGVRNVVIDKKIDTTSVSVTLT